MRSEPSLARSRTRGQRTATGPMPVMISRSGRCPWRTSRWRPSSVSLSAWLASKTATSASTACASSARAPLRRISVSGSAKVPGWQSWKTLALVTAYHSFGGEVEASSTPTIRRLTPSCRHQLSLIAPCRVGADGETGDFKGLTLFQLGPRLLRKPGLFLQARRGSRRRPDRRGLEPAAGTCRDATGMARQDRDNPSKTGGFKPVKLQLWLANREEEWGKKKWR